MTNNLSLKLPGLLLLLLFLVHTVCQVPKLCRVREGRHKLDFLPVLWPYISLPWIGHANLRGSYCSCCLGEGWLCSCFHRRIATLQVQRLFSYPCGTISSQRISREAALWNLVIPFISEVLGFLPNAHPSGLGWFIVASAYVYSSQFKSIYSLIMNHLWRQRFWGWLSPLWNATCYVTSYKCERGLCQFWGRGWIRPPFVWVLYHLYPFNFYVPRCCLPNF